MKPIIDSAFDGGNIRVLSANSIDDIRLTLEPDTATHFRHLLAQLIQTFRQNIATHQDGLAVTILLLQPIKFSNALALFP